MLSIDFGFSSLLLDEKGWWILTWNLLVLCDVWLPAFHLTDATSNGTRLSTAFRLMPRGLSALRMHVLAKLVHLKRSNGLFVCGFGRVSFGASFFWILVCLVLLGFCFAFGSVAVLVLVVFGLLFLSLRVWLVLGCVLFGVGFAFGMFLALAPVALVWFFGLRCPPPLFARLSRSLRPPVRLPEPWRQRLELKKTWNLLRPFARNPDC